MTSGRSSRAPGRASGRPSRSPSPGLPFAMPAVPRGCCWSVTSRRSPRWRGSAAASTSRRRSGPRVPTTCRLPAVGHGRHLARPAGTGETGSPGGGADRPAGWRRVLLDGGQSPPRCGRSAKHLMREQHLPSSAYDVMGYWRGATSGSRGPSTRPHLAGGQGEPAGRSRSGPTTTGEQGMGRAGRERAGAPQRFRPIVRQASQRRQVTLTNALVGQKVVITSDKTPDPRTVVRGIVHREGRS